MTIAVRRPICGHPRRCPDGPVVRNLAPFAIAIEFPVADHLGRHVTRARRAFLELQALRCPHIQRVAARDGLGLIDGEIGALEAIARSLRNHESVLRPEYFGLTPIDRNARGVPVRSSVDAIIAGPVDGEREIGGVDLDGVAALKLAHAQMDGALRQVELRNPIIEVDDRDVSSRREPQRCVADLELGARAVGHPQPIAVPQRPVDVRLHPLGVPGRQEAHRP